MKTVLLLPCYDMPDLDHLRDQIAATHANDLHLTLGVATGDFPNIPELASIAYHENSPYVFDAEHPEKYRPDLRTKWLVNQVLVPWITVLDSAIDDDDHVWINHATVKLTEAEAADMVAELPGHGFVSASPIVIPIPWGGEIREHTTRCLLFTGAALKKYHTIPYGDDEVPKDTSLVHIMKHMKADGVSYKFTDLQPLEI